MICPGAWRFENKKKHFFSNHSRICVYSHFNFCSRNQKWKYVYTHTCHTHRTIWWFGVRTGFYSKYRVFYSNSSLYTSLMYFIFSTSNKISRYGINELIYFPFFLNTEPYPLDGIQTTISKIIKIAYLFKYINSK